MSGPTQSTGEPITERRQLIEYLEAGSKPPERWRIGTEHEKFVFRRSDLRRVPYEGPDGIRALLNGLQRFGWTPVLENGNPIALAQGNCAISLEPGGQFELSGAPLDTLHQTCAEVHEHLRQVKQVADELKIGLIGLGFDPKSRREDVPWMPKGRYAIMRRYMPKRGSLGLDMMLRTCTVQVNLDYQSEADMVRKFRVGLALQPVAVALFANSPFVRASPRAISAIAATSGPIPTPTGPACCLSCSSAASASSATSTTCSTSPCISSIATAATSTSRANRSVTSWRASCRDCRARRRASTTGATTSPPPSPRCG
jgi:glutamate--cysteine ligase